MTSSPTNRIHIRYLCGADRAANHPTRKHFCRARIRTPKHLEWTRFKEARAKIPLSSTASTSRSHTRIHTYTLTQTYVRVHAHRRTHTKMCAHTQTLLLYPSSLYDTDWKKLPTCNIYDTSSHSAGSVFFVLFKH